MHEMTVHKHIDIDASPQKVWRVITEADFTRQYMYSCAIDSTWQPGTAFNWRAPNGNVMVKGALVEANPGHFLQYTTFDPNATDYEDEPANYSTVLYSLHDEGGKTHLTVSQGDFSHIVNGHKRYEECEAAWPEVLEKIKDVAEAA